MRLVQLFVLAAVIALPIAAVALWTQWRDRDAAPLRGRWTLPVDERRHDAFPRTYINAIGETVVIPAAPQAIVSATIFSDAVLLDVCPEQRIAALHSLSEDPRFSPVAGRSAEFPRHTTGDPEDILAAAPDLVILSSFSRHETVQLVGGGNRTVVRFASFDSLEHIRNNLRGLGYVLGLDVEVERLIDTMDQRLAAVAGGADARAAHRVLLYEDGLIAGGETTFGSLLRCVGARNVADELGVTGFQKVEVETLLSADPDIIVVGCEPGGEGRRRARLLQLPGFEHLRAVREDRLLFVSSALLQSTSHHVAGAAEAIAARLDAWR